MKRVESKWNKTFINYDFVMNSVIALVLTASSLYRFHSTPANAFIN